MQIQRNASISGHVYLKRGKRGDSWYFRGRLPEEVRERLGPAWRGNGRPPAGYLTKKTAEAERDRRLTLARSGQLVGGGVKTGATVADAAVEWLRHREQERALTPSTMDGYRTTL